MALSQHDFPKNSSVMIEILSHGLTEISKTHIFDMASASLHVQSDNTVREMKNNPFLKHMAVLLSHGL